MHGIYSGYTQNPNHISNKDKEIDPNQKQDASSKDTINRRSRDRNKAQVKNLNHINKELGSTSNSNIQTSEIASKPTISQPEINTKENNLDFQPKNNKLHETSESDHKYAVTLSPIKNSCLTPVLPPKKKLGFPRFRSRSRNRNVAQLGDPSEADYSPQIITDVMHQRLLPKENCVTNILYARRLPSPPVFRKKVSQEDSKNLFARDDQFVEKRGVEGSCFSPNRRYCNNPYEGMEGLHGEINGPQLYCPLCVSSFGYSFGLECHLLSAHQDVLRVAQNEPYFVQDVLLDRSEWCPCCSAQFLSSGLLTKHLLSVHSEYTLNCIDQELVSTRSMNTNPTRQQLQCNFCGQSFQRRHQKLFIQHIESKHIGELEAMLLSKDFFLQNGLSQLQPQLLKSERKMSMEVKLMLSLSKTSTISFNKQIHVCKQENHCDTEEGPKSATLNRKDRFGSLRSSLRRKKRNSGTTQRAISPNGLDQSKDANAISLINDKQFIQAEKHTELKIDDTLTSCKSPNVIAAAKNEHKLPSHVTFDDTLSKGFIGNNKSTKRMLRFSIPEVTHYNNGAKNVKENQYNNNEDKQYVQNSRIKRDRGSVDDISTHTSRPTVRCEKRRMKSLERPILALSTYVDNDARNVQIATLSRQPQYYKHNRTNHSSGPLQGTPHSNKTRSSQNPRYPLKSKQFLPDQTLHIPTTYHHIPQPEPPPPLFTSLTNNSIPTCKVGDQNVMPNKKNSLISEEEFESLSSASANSSSASTSSSFTRKQAADFSMGHENNFTRWSTTRESNHLIPLQITEHFHPSSLDDEKPLFKCNLCDASFADNVILLGHLKNRHRSSMTKALKPQFSCGVCPAKFFKNSFLIKHCESHERTR